MTGEPGTARRPRIGRGAVALASVLAALVLSETELPHAARLALGSALLAVWTGAVLGVGADLARRCDPAARPVSMWLATCLWSAGFLVALLAALGALGWLALLPAALAQALVLVWIGPPRLPAGLRISPAELLAGARREPLVALLLAGALVGIGLLVSRATLAPIFFNDDLSYHAVAPLEWIQRGNLARIHPPFGNHSPAYYPKNLELLFAWALLALGDLGLLTAFQGLARALLVLAAAALGRELGATRSATAAIAGLTLIEPSSTTNLSSLYGDVAFAASTVAVVWALVRLRARPGGGRLLQLGLALGLLLGTKVLAVFYLAVVLLPLAAILWLSRRPSAQRLEGPPRRRSQVLLAPLLACAVLLASGGWWYLRNLVQTGNPLFPLLVEFRGWTVFDGGYDQSDLPYGDLRGLLGLFAPAPTDPRQWIVLLYLAPFLLAALVCAARAVRDARARLPLLLGVALPLWIGFAVVSWVPFGYPRFCLAAYGLAGLPLLVALGGGRGSRHAVAAACLLPPLLTCFVPAQRGAIWNALPMRALQSGLAVNVGLSLVFLSLMIGLALICLHLAPRVRRAGWLALGLLLLGGAQIASRTSDPSSPHVARSVRELWLPSMTLEEAGEPLRVATTGTTWLLQGYGWRGRNRVEYVHVDALGPLPFHERVRRLAPRRDELRGDRTGHGYYRADADPEAWLANLRARRIQVLICWRLPRWIAIRGEYSRDPQGFPLESAWAEARPELFRSLVSTPNVRIYAFEGG